MKIKSRYLANTIIIIMASKNHQWMLKLESESGIRNRSFLQLMYLYKGYLLTTEEKYINLQWRNLAAAVTAKSLQSCLTLCNPTDGSPPGSTIPGILQARKLEWVAISFSNTYTYIHSFLDSFPIQNLTWSLQNVE